AVAAEETQRRNHELAVDVALDVDLEQRRAQRFERGAYIDRCGTEAGAAGSSCPLELIFDDVVHPPDLLVELFRDCKLATIRAAEQVTHDRERRLEAVREIAQRVAIASQSLPLTAQQGIEIRGHAEQLARILCPQLRHAPRFDLLDLMFDSPQRSQQPPQQERERADQQQHQQAEPAEQLTAEAVELRVVRLQILRDAVNEGPGHAVVELPGDAATQRAHGRAVAAMQLSILPLTGRQLHREVQPGARQRVRAPARIAVAAQNLAVQTRAGILQTLFGFLERRLQTTAAVFFRGGNQREHLRFEAVVHRLLGDAAEREVERRDGDAKEHDQQDADRGEQSCTEGARPHSARNLTHWVRHAALSRCRAKR